MKQFLSIEHKKSVDDMLKEFDRRIENIDNPKEPEIKIKCKICKVKLNSHHKSSMPSNPVFGQTYYSYIDYYYCPKCGLMYQKVEK